MDYERIFLYWINKLSFQSRKELTSRFADAGENIAAEEWACLLILWRFGVLSPGAIAENTVRDRTTATRLIDRLEKKGLVRRVADKSDGRRVQVELTDRGEGLKAVLVPIAQKFVMELIEGIPPADMETTHRTIQTISRRLDDLSE